jgi:predicted MFS family arabinose efflux permease
LAKKSIQFAWSWPFWFAPYAARWVFAAISFEQPKKQTSPAIAAQLNSQPSQRQRQRQILLAMHATALTASATEHCLRIESQPKTPLIWFPVGTITQS